MIAREKKKTVAVSSHRLNMLRRVSGILVTAFILGADRARSFGKLLENTENDFLQGRVPQQLPNNCEGGVQPSASDQLETRSLQQQPCPQCGHNQQRSLVHQHCLTALRSLRSTLPRTTLARRSPGTSPRR